jgi:hypothetical protein
MKYPQPIPGIHYDKEYQEVVETYNWSIHKGYYYTKISSKKSISKKQYNLYLHQLVMGEYPVGKTEIDHIDNNPLNNKKSNLRFVSHAENMKNRKDNKIGKTTSKYCCVYKEKNRSKYYARVQVNKKRIFLGSFDTELEALKAIEDFYLISS